MRRGRFPTIAPLTVQEDDYGFVYGATRGGRSFRDPGVAMGSSPEDELVDAMQEFEISSSRGSSRAPSPNASRPDSPIAGVERTSLQRLVQYLNTNTGLRLYKKAYRDNMLYKVDRYNELLEEANRDVQKHLAVIDIKMPELKRLAKVEDDSNNWDIFESISEQYREAKDRSAIFESLRDRARARLGGSMNGDEVYRVDAVRELRDDLVSSLERLANFEAQRHVVRKVVDIVASFLKDPKFFRRKMMNFMLVGSAGTGKSTLAATIGDVFARTGIFVGSQLVEAGRAELVGQYEGMTVARTRNFLLSNLDNGVVFIDEAYAITPWQNGKPEGYGSEAATAMVEFMTRYTGLYCIIVAGYEKEMTRYFLPTNEGMSRRFPNKFVLQNMTPDDLVHVFKRQLLLQQGLAVPDGRDTTLESEGYFTPDAWIYLTGVVAESLQHTTDVDEENDSATRRTYKNVRTIVPTHELMYEVFANQAGSMQLLAEEAVLVLLTTLAFEDVTASHRRTGLAIRPSFTQQPVEVMQTILEQRISSMALSRSEEYVNELRVVEQIVQ